MSTEKRGSDGIPLPPKDYMELVCGPGNEHLVAHFEEVGRNIWSALKDEGLVRPGDRMLDVGCGCGRVARHFLAEDLRSYTGFDRHRGMIDWCQQQLGSRAPNFEFLYCDIKSAYSTSDGDVGHIDAAFFRFPFEDASFDVALLASVFTHMPMEESANYLRELRRVTAPDGRIVLSVFFCEGEPYAEDINFYYDAGSFWEIVKQAGFEYRLRGDEVLYDSHHNWHVLTRAQG